MNNLIKEFNNKEFRFHDVDNKTRLVCARDVLTYLNYKDTKRSWMTLKPIVEQFSGQGCKTIHLWYDRLNRAYPTDFINEEQVITLMLKSNKPEAMVFFKWCLSVINKELTKLSTPLLGTEEQLSLELNLLAGRSNNRLQFEYSVEDTYQKRHSDGNLRCRRLDILEKFPKMTRVYELKRRELTANEIFKSINKMYLELASKIQPGKPIDFVMVGESIGEEGKRYIERYNAQTKYKDFKVGDCEYRAKIRYMTINNLAEYLYNKALKNTPKAAIWELNSFVLKYCNSIFNEEFKKKLQQKLFRPVSQVQFTLKE